MLNLNAIVMAGGEGTRLRPLTANRPKPMVPLFNKPLLEYIVEHLKNFNVNRIGFTLHYLPSTVIDYFGDGSKWGLEIIYSVEEKPLGTAGGVRKLYDELGSDSTAIVFSGDLFTNIDLGRMLKYHKEKGSVFTIALRKAVDPTQYGIALLNTDGKVVRFLEKPSWGEVFSDLINMGVYIVEPEALKLIPRGLEYDFSKNLIPELIKRGMEVYGFRADDYYWNDIGSFEQYREVHLDVLSGKAPVPRGSLGREVSEGVYVQGEADVSREADISPPVVIGGETVVRKGCRIGPFSVIGLNNIIDHNAVIERSILWNHVYVGSFAQVNSAIIGEKARVESHAYICEDCIIGDETVIGKGSIVKPGVKIWPSKIVDPYTTVSTSLKWGIRWYKNLVDPWGITGLANIEITSEHAAKIGLAVGSWVKSGSRVAVAYDNYSTSRAAAYAIISGLLSAGVRVEELGLTPLPVLVNYIVSRKADAGIIVSTLTYEPARVRVKIFDRSGLFIGSSDARTIEAAFFKESYRRVTANETGVLTILRGHVNYYVELLVNEINGESVRKAGKFLVDCLYGTVAQPLTSITNELNAQAFFINCREESPVLPPEEAPLNTSVEFLSRVVPSMNLAAGFIFDSDGDKLLVIDDLGKSINLEVAAILIAKAVLEERSGIVIVPETASTILEKYINELGGRMVRAGLGLMGVADAIRKYSNVVLAIDDRGGFIYPWLHPGPDAIYTSLKILEYIGSKGVKLSELVNEIPEPYREKVRIHVPYNYRGVFMRTLFNELKGKEVESIDGIKVIEEDVGWAYIRPLPSEPIVEVMVEGVSPEKEEKMLKMILSLIEEVKKRIV